MNEEFSVAKDLSGNIAEGVTDDQVVKHLQDNPGFFLNHPQLLLSIRLPHDSGNAVSLVEKQVNILRERGIEATKKLRDLTDNARTNDEIFEVTKSLILALLNCNTIEEVSISVRKHFLRLENVEVCELVFLNHSMLSLSTAIRVEDSKVIKEKFSDVFRLEKSFCARLAEDQILYLFPSSEENISSTALCPVNGNGENFALLALGNKTPNHFNVNLDTLFLDFICKVLGTVIWRLANPVTKNQV
mgnify:FL=1